MRRTSIGWGVAVASLLAVTACGTSPTSPTTTGSSVGATSSTPPAATSSDIAGTWHADVHDLLASASSQLPASVNCTGPVVLTFSATGTATDALQMSCTIHGVSASGTINASANYAVNGSHVSFTNIQNSGSVQVMGITVPFPAAFSDSGADFQVSGNDLTVTVSAGATTIHQTYHRG